MFLFLYLCVYLINNTSITDKVGLYSDDKYFDSDKFPLCSIYQVNLSKLTKNSKICLFPHGLRQFIVGRLLIGFSAVSVCHLPQWILPFSSCSHFVPNPLSFCIWILKCIFTWLKKNQTPLKKYYRHLWLTFNCLCKISLLEKNICFHNLMIVLGQTFCDLHTHLRLF